MTRRIKSLWRRLHNSWLFEDDLAETYPRQDHTADGQELAPHRHVNFNALPGGVI